MKKIVMSIFATMGLLAAGSVMAVDMPAEGKAKCGACHAIDKKVVGPAWMEVAKKYKGDANAASTIAANVTKGGQFGWKMGMMPARGLGASDADIQKLAKFIVSLAGPVVAAPAAKPAAVAPAAAAPAVAEPVAAAPAAVAPVVVEPVAAAPAAVAPVVAEPVAAAPADVAPVAAAPAPAPAAAEPVAAAPAAAAPVVKPAAAPVAVAKARSTEMPAEGKAKCGACHAVDKKVVGPAWKDVAKKYSGDAQAESKIAANVTKGGQFGWKMGMMPAKGLGASEADIKKLAKFITELN